MRDWHNPRFDPETEIRKLLHDANINYKKIEVDKLGWIHITTNYRLTNGREIVLSFRFLNENYIEFTDDHLLSEMLNLEGEVFTRFQKYDFDEVYTALCDLFTSASVVSSH